MRRIPGQPAHRGQAAVLMALSLFSMVVFLALATNMGILVNDRIRMQNTADLTAYAGAFEQARLLNRLTQQNRRIFHVADMTRKQLTCKDMPDLEEAVEADEQAECNSDKHRVLIALGCERPPRAPEAYLDMQQARMDLLAAAFMGTNYRGKGAPNRAGRFTALRNIPGLGRPRHHSFYEYTPGSPTSLGMPPTPLVDVVRLRTKVHYAQWYRRGQCSDICPAWAGYIPINFGGCIEIFDRYLDTWFTKSITGPTLFFPTRVNGVPKKNFLDIDTRDGGYFGAGAGPGGAGEKDALFGFAVAKPYGGHLGHGENNGDPQWVKFQFLIAKKSGWVYDYNSFPDYDANYLQAFNPSYRARLAGLKEEMMDSGGGQFYPIQLMMTDLFMATHASPDEIKEYVLH